MPDVVVIVDGAEFPVDLGAVTAEQVVLLRALSVSPETLAVVVAQEDTGTAALPEVVALVALSLTQTDQPCDLAWLARHITAESDLALRKEDAEPSAELIAAAEAVLARASAT